MLRHNWTMNGMDGAELYVREWLPQEKPVRGAVCLLHGLGEHGERYAHLAEAFAAAGFACVVPDQRGHGQTEGKRGHTPLQDAVRDAEAALRETAARYPSVPVFLYGHSMGGNIALNCALRLKPDISGLILSSPWLRLAFRPPAAKLWLGRRIAKLAPGFTQGTGLRLEDLFRPGFITPEPDRYVHTVITASTYFGLEEAGEWALAHAGNLSCKVLLLHGTADRITSWKASSELAARLGEQCRFLSWEDGFHELHNDLSGREVMAAMIDWMQYQL